MLQQLLATLFIDSELRAFLMGIEGGAQLLTRLPSPPVSLFSLTVHASFALARHGFVDQDFFDGLARAYPRRRQDIAAVAMAWAPRLARS